MKLETIHFPSLLWYFPVLLIDSLSVMRRDPQAVAANSESNARAWNEALLFYQ